MTIDRPRNVLVLGLGEALARVVAFGAGLYLARTLGPVGYGLIGVATAVLLYLQAIADAGVDMIGVRVIARNPERAAEVAGAVVPLRTALAAGVAALALVIGLAGPQPEGALIGMYALALPLLGVSSKWIHLGRERVGWVVVARVCGELLAATLVITLVRSIGDAERVPIAFLIGESVSALILALALRRAIGVVRLRVDLPAAIPVFKAGGSLALHAVLGLVVFNADLLFVRAIHTPAMAGQYVAAYALVSFLINVGIATSQGVLPALTRRAAVPDDQQTYYAAAMTSAIALALPVALGGAVLAPGIVRAFFGDRFAEAGGPMMILLCSVPVSVIRNIGMIGLVSKGGEALTLRTAWWAAGTNLVLNALLVPGLAMHGAALATLMTEILRATMMVWFSARRGLAPAGLGGLLRPISATAGMVAVLLPLRDLPPWLTVPLGVAVWGILLVAFGGVRWRRGEFPALKL